MNKANVAKNEAKQAKKPLSKAIKQTSGSYQDSIINKLKQIHKGQVPQRLGTIGKGGRKKKNPT